MIKIENLETYGWEAAIRGMRNPMNSWKFSDTNFNEPYLRIGPNDLILMTKLASAGPVHAKYRRMITITMDIAAPLYWWKEYDTYKVGTVANSCSTMHKISAKPFEMSDFSTDKLVEFSVPVMEEVINALNTCRHRYLESDDENEKKLWWWQLIQLLPSSYNQKRTVQINYEVASHMYADRHNHKLDEWREFCAVLEGLYLGKELIVNGRYD